MTGYPLSTGEAVQHVLEGRECESEDGRRFQIDGGWLVIADHQYVLNPLTKADAKVRWRLVPKLVKREEAIKALAAGKKIRRGERFYFAALDTGHLRCHMQNGVSWHTRTADFAADFLDETACWEILP